MEPLNSNISRDSVVYSLGSHVERLMADHLRLVQRVGELNEECDKLRDERREQLNQISQLQHQLAQSNLAAALGESEGSEDRQQARAYVNRLMREVDTCIKLLAAATTDSDSEK